MAYLDKAGANRLVKRVLGKVDEKLAGKQDVGEYLTEAKAVEAKFIKYQNYGSVRNRDSTKPTYGL